MRTRAIVNPHSGGRKTAGRWPGVRERIEAAIGPIEVAFTDAVGAGTELTRQALHDGVEQILAVGGDGTVNEVVNGFFEGEHAINPKAVLALAMLGTGGDFRKTFGIGAQVDAFVQRLTEGTPKPIDVGRIEFVDHDGRPAARWFGNIASFGLSGEVVEAVNRANFSKKLGGSFAFKWASFTALLRHRDVPVRISVDEGEPITGNITIAAVCNGQYFGGGMHVAPNAVVDDGLFDVVLMRDLTTLDFVRSSKTIYRGEHLDMDNITVLRGRRIVAEPLREEDVVLLDVDGEAPGRLPATLQIHPGALELRY